MKIGKLIKKIFLFSKPIKSDIFELKKDENKVNYDVRNDFTKKFRE